MDRIFWLLALGGTALQAYSLKRRVRSLIAEKPELEEGYEKIFKGYLFFGSLPWIVMGVGVLSGGAHGVFDFFRPGDGNPYVLAFHLVIIGIWTLSALWIFFGEDAEFLVRHPGLFNWRFKSPIAIKILLAISLAGGIAGMYLMWTMPPLAR